MRWWRFHRWALAGLAVLMTSLAIGAAAPSAASAGECSISGAICLFAGTNFSGAKDVITEGPSSGWLFLAGFNNQAQSFISTKPNDARLADGGAGEGAAHCIPAHTSQATMGAFNGLASSYFIYGNANVCQ